MKCSPQPLWVSLNLLIHTFNCLMFHYFVIFSNNNSLVHKSRNKCPNSIRILKLIILFTFCHETKTASVMWSWGPHSHQRRSESHPSATSDHSNHLYQHGLCARSPARVNDHSNRYRHHLQEHLLWTVGPTGLSDVY